MSIHLYRYNEKIDIYYGDISLLAYPSVTSKSKYRTQRYINLDPIAGSSTQIKRSIKEKIEKYAQTFASDCMYIESIVTE